MTLFLFVEMGMISLQRVREESWRERKRGANKSVRKRETGVESQTDTGRFCKNCKLFLSPKSGPFCHSDESVQSSFLIPIILAF